MREKIKLESTAGTGHFYTTTKNKRSTPDKIEMKKYDPRARRHVIYKETKIKSGTVKSSVLATAERRKLSINGVAEVRGKPGSNGKKPARAGFFSPARPERRLCVRFNARK